MTKLLTTLFLLCLVACSPVPADKSMLAYEQSLSRLYNDFSQRLTQRFPQLTVADVQLCLLMRLRFTNAQVATLIAVSPASVSQQKFRLKKRLMQTDETLFKNGETVDGVICAC